MNKNESILVCGTGSIANRHIENLISLGESVAVYGTTLSRLKSLNNRFTLETGNELLPLIEKAKAVVVANETYKHLEVANRVLESKKPLFIEKPISHNWDQISNFHRLCNGNIVEVGFQFRTHPTLIKLSELINANVIGRIYTYHLCMGYRLDKWRVNRKYLDGYSANASLGGGALLDLIHQIDLANWFFGPVVSVQAVLSSNGLLKIIGDEVACLTLTHSNGIVGQIQLDMLSPINKCQIEIKSDTSVITWDAKTGSLLDLAKEPVNLIDSISTGFQRNDLFLTHMRHWLRRISNNSIDPICTYEDGISALRVALAAKKSNDSGYSVKL
jgi:predicted dehydrogenase